MNYTKLKEDIAEAEAKLRAQGHLPEETAIKARLDGFPRFKHTESANGENLTIAEYDDTYQDSGLDIMDWDDDGGCMFMDIPDYTDWSDLEPQVREELFDEDESNES